MLAPCQRCTHECPQYKTSLDRNRFDKGDKDGVVRGKHENPRELIEDACWGFGYHSPLTEVVEEDESSEVSS